MENAAWNQGGGDQSPKHMLVIPSGAGGCSSQLHSCFTCVHHRHICPSWAGVLGACTVSNVSKHLFLGELKSCPSGLASFHMKVEKKEAKKYLALCGNQWTLSLIMITGNMLLTAVESV